MLWTWNRLNIGRHLLLRKSRAILFRQAFFSSILYSSEENFCLICWHHHLDTSSFNLIVAVAAPFSSLLNFLSQLPAQVWSQNLSFNSNFIFIFHSTSTLKSGQLFYFAAPKLTLLLFILMEPCINCCRLEFITPEATYNRCFLLFSLSLSLLFCRALSSSSRNWWQKNLSM